jgi:hypothetical protein
MHNFYSSPNIIRMNKSRKMRRAFSAYGVRRGMCTGFWWEIQKERNQ